jgi:cytochrome c peroxidase
MSSDAKKFTFGIATLLSVTALIFSGFGIAQATLTPQEELGQFLYFDENLSEPAGQSCASCHHPDKGFDDEEDELPVSEGVIPGLFGSRNSPSSAYAMYAPILYFDEEEGLWIGGQFWDGRATGEVLGDPLADQALGPFLNPVEMANPDKETVIRDVLASEYSDLFISECGAVDLTNEDQVNAAYDCVALSIAAFERSSLFGQFSSKYDFYLQECLDEDIDKDDCAMGINDAAIVAEDFFTKHEWRGFQLFMGENNNDGILEPGEGAMCSACHVVDWPEDPGNVIVPDWAPDGFVPPLFTDFTFDNLGVPKNTEYPLDPDAPVDLGLGAIVEDEEENGKFKVMTLRNIKLTEPYGHNGFFKELEDITHFYNTREVPEMGWPDPEYPDTVNNDELGNLGLSSDDEDDLVHFMKTLSDGYTGRGPKNR